MTDSHHPPLSYEASATTTHPQISTTLPPEVVTCLENARFLHLATISTPANSPPIPHVSLMNYTFLSSYPSSSSSSSSSSSQTADAVTTGSLRGSPTIIMTTNAQSLKTRNLLSNPRVSLLVHDWVSHRPPTAKQGHSSAGGGREGSSPVAVIRSSLASLLLNLNTSALSSISTTITGEARFLEQGSEEERWCKEAHLQNNTFGEQAMEEAGLLEGRVRSADTLEGGGGGIYGTSNCYIEGNDVRVVLVKVSEGRIADWKGGVKDWLVVDDTSGLHNITTAGADDRGRRDEPQLVSGISH